MPTDLNWQPSRASWNQGSENANRGDWRTLNFYYLVAALTSNVGQLIRSFQVDKPDIVLRSAADTANYAMMIADLYGELSKRKK
jgi:hypothetical protein